MESPVSIYAAPAAEVQPSSASAGTLTLVELKRAWPLGWKLIVPGHFTFPGICPLTGRTDDLGPLETHPVPQNRFLDLMMLGAAGILFNFLLLIYPLETLAGFSALILAALFRRRSAKNTGQRISYRVSGAYKTRRRIAVAAGAAAIELSILGTFQFDEAADLLPSSIEPRTAESLTKLALSVLFTAGLVCVKRKALKLFILPDGWQEVTGMSLRNAGRVQTACREAVEKTGRLDSFTKVLERRRTK